MKLTGTKLTGVKLNIPYQKEDYNGQGLTTSQVNTILSDLDAISNTELTWRVINLLGNDVITDKVSYDSLIAKGWIIYGETSFDFKVNFNTTNNDYIDFGTGKAWIDINDFSIEVEISDYEDVAAGIIGQSSSISSSGRWALSRGGVEGITFVAGATGGGDLSMPFVSDGIIKVTGLNGDYEMFLNDISMDTHSDSRVPINLNFRMLIGSFSLDGGTPNLFASGIVHWAKITSFGVTNYINLNEGVGNIVTSSEGDVGEIKTSEPTGITYINNTMWEEDI